MEPTLDGVVIGMRARKVYKARPQILKDDYSTWEQLEPGHTIRYWFHDGPRADISHVGQRLAAVRGEWAEETTPDAVRDSVLRRLQQVVGPPTDTIIGCVSLLNREPHRVQVLGWRRPGLIFGVEALYRTSGPIERRMRSLRITVQHSSVPLERTLPGLAAYRAISVSDRPITC